MYAVNKNLEEYTKNFEWFNRNYEMLKKNYPNKIVAVDKEQVIYDSANLKDVEKIRSKNPYAYIGSVIVENLLWIL